MRIAKTTDTGAVGDVALLSEELLTAASQFERATEAVAGELFIAFRSLPREYERRSTVRYSSAEGVLFVDLAVAEEDIAGLELSEQREILREGLSELVRRGVRSRTAGWSREEQGIIVAAFDAMLAGADGTADRA
ncbi:hypothetical protein [Leucobacter aridicollis]|uniref:hypothetical protein n=1 Tax=Leucobacter aridicollis TaxID=283878 RepID=UPI002105BDC6|nr:hypothetical protein [Leucobacter aridicollis]UTX54329.1 hypothetical protein KI794_06425 [Leucobacter aridicollis]